MSTLQSNQQAWPLQDSAHSSKYEKCLNITEEIYKRINITFEIKKLETGSQSDVSNHSDVIDSNELSNETDLFAYEKSSSISSSASDAAATQACEKFINLNNNEEAKFKKTVSSVTAPRPKKRFRKRIKKRRARSNRSDTDCSSDEGLPLSRIVDASSKGGGETLVEYRCIPPTTLSGNLKIKLNKVEFPRISTEVGKVQVDDSTKEEAEVVDRRHEEHQIIDNEESSLQDHEDAHQPETIQCEPLKEEESTEMSKDTILSLDGSKDEGHNIKNNVCPLCSSTFRGSRGLKRHMTMSHISPEDGSKVSSPPK